MWPIRIFVTLYVLAVTLLAPALLFAAVDQPPQSKQTAPPEATPAAQAPPTAAADPAPDITPPPPAPSAGTPAPPKPRPPVLAERKARARAVARAAATDTIADFSFQPKTITVTAGETVTWHNTDAVGHSATADGGNFDTGVIDSGSSGSRTFDTPGTYAFHCTPHPYMKGTVRVLAAGSSGGGTPSSDSTTGSSAGSNNGSSGPSPASSGSSSSSPSGSGLPSTGLDIGLLVLLGIGLLCCGAGLRLRLGARDERS